MLGSRGFPYRQGTACFAPPLRSLCWDPAALARRHLAAAREVPMSAPRPPPPTNYERPYGWWELRSKLSKAAIIIGGFVGVLWVIGIVGSICAPTYPAPNADTPRPTRAPHPYGHHCLSSWDGHHRATKFYLKGAYSGEVRWTETSKRRQNGMHWIEVGWTGEDKWGDEARAVAKGWLDPETCEVSIVSWQ